MNSFLVFNSTMWIQYLYFIILGLQDFDLFFFFWDAIIGISIFTIILIIDLLSQRFDFKHRNTLSILRNIFLISILSQPGDYIIVEDFYVKSILSIRKIFLGIYLMLLLQENNEILSRKQVFRNSFYVFYTVLMITFTINTDDLKYYIRFLLIIILIIPYQLSLFYEFHQNYKKVFIGMQKNKQQIGFSQNIYQENSISSIRHEQENRYLFMYKNQKSNEQKKNQLSQPSVLSKNSFFKHSFLSKNSLQDNRPFPEIQYIFCSIYTDNSCEGVVIVGKYDFTLYTNSALNEIFNQKDEKKNLQKLFDLPIQQKQFLTKEKNFQMELKQQNVMQNDSIGQQDCDYGLNFDQNLRSVDIYSVQDECQEAMLKAEISQRNNLLIIPILGITGNKNSNQFDQRKSQKKDQFKSKDEEKFFKFESKFQVQMKNDQNSEIINEIEIKQQDVNQEQNRLLEINIKSFIYRNTPYVLIVVKVLDYDFRSNLKYQDEFKQQQFLLQQVQKFRNPLDSILKRSQYEMQKQQSNHLLCKQFFGPTISKTFHLLNIANDLKDLILLKSGEFKINKQEIDLADLINKFQVQMLPQTDAKNLYLKVRYGKHLPNRIVSDPVRIIQILMNLVQNSLKFTIIGGITIGVRLQGENFYEISVSDTGIGIEIEDQQILQKAFNEIQESYQLQEKEIGFGLLISNSIAKKLSQKDKEKFQHQIQVQSQGEIDGTHISFRIVDHSKQKQKVGLIINKVSDVFIVSSQNIQKQNEDIINNTGNKIESMEIIPLLFSNIRIQGENEQDFSPKNLSNESHYSHNQYICPQILIVDYDPFYIQTIKDALEKEHLQIETATSSYETFQMLIKINFEDFPQWIRIIFLDLEMPIQNGLEMATQIRNIEKQLINFTNFIPSFIVGCSIYQNIQLQQQCYEVGMNYYITKPLNIDQFKNIKRMIIGD